MKIDMAPAGGPQVVGLAVNLQGRPERQPLRGAEGGHVRQMGYVPEHHILFLDALVVLVITELAPGSEDP